MGITHARNYAAEGAQQGATNASYLTKYLFDQRDAANKDSIEWGRIAAMAGNAQNYEMQKYAQEMAQNANPYISYDRFGKPVVGANPFNASNPANSNEYRAQQRQAYAENYEDAIRWRPGYDKNPDAEHAFKLFEKRRQSQSNLLELQEKIKQLSNTFLPGAAPLDEAIKDYKFEMEKIKTYNRGLGSPRIRGLFEQIYKARY